MAYRSVINSTTKYSPYELVFGIPMQIFSFEGGLTKTEEAELFQRSVELKNLTENKRLAQEIQKDTQNKILDHKDENNVRYYLVKWKDLDDSENSWEPEKNFNTKGIIKQYLKSITTKNSEIVQKRPRERPPKIKPMLIMSVIWMLLITLGVGQDNSSWNEVQANVYLCSGAYNKFPIDIESVCKEQRRNGSTLREEVSKQINKEVRERKNSGETKRVSGFSSHYLSKTQEKEKTCIKVDIYAKEMHSIVGKGTQCYKEKITWTFHKSLLGIRVRSSIQDNVIMSSFECMLMDEEMWRQSYELLGRTLYLRHQLMTTPSSDQ